MGAAQQQRCNKNRNKRKLQTMSKQIARMEDEVYQAMAVMDASTGKMLNYRQLRRDPKYKIQWDKSAANEFGRLADGVGNRVKGTKTIEFIRKCNVPQARMKDVTYGSFVCNVRNKKTENNRTRFVLDGDRRDACRKTAIHQRHFNRGGAVHDDGYFKLLLHDTIVPT